MKALIVLISLLVSSSLVHAKPFCKKQRVEDFVKTLGEAYEAKKLRGLDAARPYRGQLRLVIEHSLADDGPDQFVIMNFKTLRNLELWLSRREFEGAPVRVAKPLRQCKGGVCEFDFEGGINHRSLYLQKISYGYRGGCPYIKTIYLLDGD